MEAIGKDWAGELREPSVARSRDQELVRFVGRFGLVRIEHVMAAMGVGRTAAYRRVASCIDAGLLEGVELLRSEPRLLRATRSGLRYAGLGLPFAQVSSGTVNHLLRCASVAVQFGHDDVLSEREIVLAEQIAERPVATVEVNGSPGGRPLMHRADLALLTDEGIVAIEVELTPKAPKRLQGLMRAWRRAIGSGVLSGVRYLCEPGQTRRAVERAVTSVHAEGFIQIGEAPPR